MANSPEITLLDGHGESYQLENDLHQWIVLFFYPKDMTSGCSQEAADFATHYASFQEQGCNVIGISPDSVKSHKKFIDKLELPYTLLADTEKTVCESFSVWKEKSMYGKKYFGVERSTFLLNSKRQVVESWRKVKVPGHVEKVLASLREAAAS
jgi:peroxiredoxin Q/BCP